jgi:hypothetical protein
MDPKASLPAKPPAAAPVTRGPQGPAPHQAPVTTHGPNTARTQAPAPAAPKPMSWPTARTQMTPTVPQKPGPRQLVGQATVFGARVAGFYKADVLSPQQVTLSRTFSAIKLRHEELQRVVVGDKGLNPDKVGVVLEFVEWARLSAGNFEDEMQRASLAQMVKFWARQVTGLVAAPQTELAEYVGAEAG